MWVPKSGQATALSHDELVQLLVYAALGLDDLCRCGNKGTRRNIVSCRHVLIILVYPYVDNHPTNELKIYLSI